MNEYVPDKWVIIKINLHKETAYKVFACWYGGYMGSDSWKMNSGIKSVTETKHYWKFKGFSGSIYKCRKCSYGLSAYGAAVLNSFVVDAKKQNITIKILEDTNWKTFIYE